MKIKMNLIENKGKLWLIHKYLPDYTGIRQSQAYASGKFYQGGWILPDAMIAVVITVIALVAIMALYTQVTNSTMVARDYQNATYITQQQLETLRQYDGTAKIKDLDAVITDPPTITIDHVVYTVEVRSMISSVSPNISSSITMSETLDTRIVPYEVKVIWTDSKGSVQSLKVANYYYSN